MKIQKTISTFTAILCLALLSACGSDKKSNDTATTEPPSNCGQIATANYTFSWDAIQDADLRGYKVYYGTSNSLTKSNALGSLDVDSAQASIIFFPADYNILSCTQLTIATSAVGLRQESALSDLQFFQVE
jgi:hypothetical protein